MLASDRQKNYSPRDTIPLKVAKREIFVAEFFTALSDPIWVVGDLGTDATNRLL